MYCTTAEVRRRAAGGSGSGGSATTTALPEAELEALILQASRFFDLVCGVKPEHFEPAGDSVSDLVVYGDGTNFLRLPPYVPGTLNSTITFPDGYSVPTFIERDGYLILSSNGVALSRFGSSWHEDWHAGWYVGVPITVSAKWGYEATPEDVKMAVIELVINLWRETDPATVKLINLEGQPLREKIPPRVWEVAKRYRANGVVFV